jgi:hypothetical protein
MATSGATLSGVDQLTAPVDNGGWWRQVVRKVPRPSPSAAAWIVGVVVVVFMLAWVARSQSEGALGHAAMKKKIHSLVRTAAQGSWMAEQDANPVISLLHANTALTYAQLAQRLVERDDILRDTRVDINHLVFHLEEQQLAAMKALHRTCPAAQSDGVFAPATGWVG